MIGQIEEAAKRLKRAFKNSDEDYDDQLFSGEFINNNIDAILGQELTK